MDSGESRDRVLHEGGARKVKVMLVDDDAIFLKVAVDLLERHHRDQLDIVGTATSSEECIIKAQTLAPEVVLIDLNMPGHGGLWAIPLLHILFPETRVIALTSRDGKDARRAVVSAGGVDLVSKMAWKTDLIPAIRRAVDSDALYVSSVSV
jgi:DNA-binding NarL/FixJ family response regulator